MTEPLVKSMGISVRIVALGDSLTTGFEPYGFPGGRDGVTPYTNIIDELIRRDFPPSSLTAEIINKGIVGQVTRQMVTRFASDVIALSPEIVIILGGSNDLGWGLSPRYVFSNLNEMYELSLHSGIIPIAVTVPSVLGYDEGIPPRKELNRLIRERCLEGKLRCVDLFAATADLSTGRMNERYSSDGLHLNAEGYRQMGTVVYRDAVAPLLRTLH